MVEVPDWISLIRISFRSAIDEESQIAYDHKNDYRFMSSRGQNIAQDEYRAIVYASRVKLEPTMAESADACVYANRILKDLENAKAEYCADEIDPDGYGAGTFHSIIRKVTRCIDDLKIFEA